MTASLSLGAAAVFPNRFEGGTNLVAMECMACGLPTMLRCATGQGDLPVQSISWLVPECYDEAAVDIVAAGMESLYNDPRAAPPLDDGWAWPARLAELRTILES